MRSLDRYVLYIDRESRERSGVGFVYSETDAIGVRQCVYIGAVRN